MAIEWNRVTKFSQVVAIILALVIFGAGFWLGELKGQAESSAPLGNPATDLSPAGGIINDVTYACAADRNVRAIYREGSVELVLSDGRHISVPQAISGSGARYANADESFVFWNKGQGAFITEGTGDAATTTYADCAQVPETAPSQG